MTPTGSAPCVMSRTTALTIACLLLVVMVALPLVPRAPSASLASTPTQPPTSTSTRPPKSSLARTMADLLRPLLAGGVDAAAQHHVIHLIDQHPVIIFSASYCKFCALARRALRQERIRFVSIDLDVRPDGEALHQVLWKMTGVSTVPCIFVRGRFLGGYMELKSAIETRWLHRTLARLR
eukprot:GGOE01018527.1.p1 GENE.GGOE01018527.1~~GGOE01018527.1.p1  ORF type:complete len:203 (+),score=37.32 GGOE01018527.1:71-610(+)